MKSSIYNFVYLLSATNNGNQLTTWGLLGVYKQYIDAKQRMWNGKQVSTLIVMSVSAFGLFHSAASSLSVRGSKCKSSWEWNKKRHNGSLWVLDTSAHCDDTVDHVKEAVIHIYHCKEWYNIEDNLQNKQHAQRKTARLPSTLNEPKNYFVLKHPAPLTWL